MVVFEYYYFNMKPFRGENMSNTHDSEYVYSVLETKKDKRITFQDKYGNCRDREYITALTMPIHDIDFLKQGSCTAILNTFLLNKYISTEAKGLFSVLCARRWYNTCIVNGNFTYIRETFTDLSSNTFQKYLQELIGYNMIKLHEYQYKGNTTKNIEVLPPNEWILPEGEIQEDTENIIPATEPHQEEYAPF